MMQDGGKVCAGSVLVMMLLLLASSGAAAQDVCSGPVVSCGRCK